eukprot:5864654-Lingulodinium_polyedra.AAC.1
MITTNPQKVAAILNRRAMAEQWEVSARIKLSTTAGTGFLDAVPLGPIRAMFLAKAGQAICIPVQ